MQDSPVPTPLRYFLVNTRTEQVVQITGTIVIGRKSGDSIYPSDSRMGDRHFKIILQGEDCLIEDLISKNPTLVNGKVIPGKSPVKLQFGDVIEAGSQKFTLSKSVKTGPGGVVLGRSHSSADSEAEEQRSAAEVLQDFFMPWRWSQFDRLAFQFSILGFGILFFKVIAPLMNSNRFPITRLDQNHLVVMAALVAGVFFIPFVFRRRSSSFAAIAGIVQGLLLVIFGAAMTAGAFLVSQNSVQALVMNDFERSCIAPDTRKVADCASTVTEVEHVIGHELGRDEKSRVEAFLASEKPVEPASPVIPVDPATPLNASPSPVEVASPSPVPTQQAESPEIQ
jgi:hypothetical protein